MRATKIMLALVFALAVAVPGLWAAQAQAHNLGYDSANASENIIYVDQTSLDGALVHARKSWNKVAANYNNRGFNIIANNADNGAATVGVYDYHNCQSSTAGYYDPNGAPGGKDLISINRCYNSTGATMVHEFGHAGRFAHPPAKKYYRLNSIMYYCAACARKSVPMFHDYKDYERAWLN